MRDAKIAAAKAAGRVRPVTTRQQRQAVRSAEKYRGWRRAPMPVEPVATDEMGPRLVLHRDDKGRAPRYSVEHMAEAKRKHSGALRRGEAKAA